MTIETTHVGSLPRGDELSSFLLAKDKGEAYDRSQFEASVQNAINDAVRLQREAGVTIVSDGELGKVGYSTYMQERLSGFGGHIERKPAKDLAAHPELSKKLSAVMGSQEFTRHRASARSGLSIFSRLLTTSAGTRQLLKPRERGQGPS